MGTFQYNYHCKTEDCPQLVQQVIIEKDEEFKDEVERCEQCNGALYCVGVLNSFYIRSSRSPQEMQKILKKRSRDHYAPDKDDFHQKNKKNILP